MTTEELSKQFTKLRIDHAKQLIRIGKALSSNGEQGVLLWLDQRSQETYAIDIIEHFGLTAGRVANIMKRLEERGFVRRVQDGGDLRKVRIEMTASGRAHAEEITENLNREHQRMVQEMGEEDARKWFDLLCQLIEIQMKNE